MNIRTLYDHGLVAIAFAVVVTAVSAKSLIAVPITPLLHYTFDTADTSGTTITDQGTGGNDGTIVGPVTSAAGVFGQAFSFNGNVSSTYIDANAAVLSTSSNTQPYTIAFWVNSTASTGDGPFSQYNGGPAERFGIRLDTFAGRPSWWKGASERAVANTNVADGLWHHVTFVKTPAQQLRAYVDGVLDTSTTDGLTNTDILAFQATDVNIGTFLTTSVLPYSGLIDEVQIFDQVLDATQIASLFAFNQTEPPPPIPEPSSLALLGLGALGLVRRQRCRRKARA